MHDYGRLIVNAKPLAAHVFKDETKYRKIYRLKTELGLFQLNGQLAGYTGVIDALLDAKLRAALAPPLQTEGATRAA